MMKKIVIVGAGPIGCYLGQLLKRRGLNALLLEEHKELGRPVHCAGLVGKKVFDEALIPLPKDCILNTINGATFHLGDDSFTIRRKEAAYVIDRERFDKSLGDGLDIRYETRFLGLEKNTKNYLIETDKGEIEGADILIGADGANSTLRNFVKPANHVKHLKGVQFRIMVGKRYKLTEDTVGVYIKRPYFYWVIPESGHTARIGVISENPYHNLLEFMAAEKIEGEILEKFAGVVPLNNFAPLMRNQIFLTGDSACQIKPLTFGGIYMGMRAAEILCDCIADNKFSDYDNRWFSRFGRELDMTAKARDVFTGLSEEDMEKIFLFAKENASLIEKKGDFENHSTLIWELLKRPNTSKELFNIFLRIIKTQFRPF